MTKRIESLTFLRFVAASLVVIYHFGENANIGALYTSARLLAPQFMAFFFTLSGFVIMISYFEKEDLSPKKFYILRAARIVPPYLFALALTALFRYGRGEHTLSALIMSATFLQAWVHPFPTTFNGPAWTVSAEMFFYFLFPFIVLLIRRRNISPGKMFSISALVFIITQFILGAILNSPSYAGYPSVDHSLVHYFPPSYLGSFLLGNAGGLIYLKYKDRVIGPGFTSYALVILALVLAFWIPLYGTNFIQSFGPALPFFGIHSLLFLGVILVLSLSQNRITDLMGSRFLALLGESSYSFYILQLPFSIIFFRYVLPWIGIELDPTLKFIVFFIALVLISILSNYYVEQPGKTLMRKIFARFENDAR